MMAQKNAQLVGALKTKKMGIQEASSDTDVWLANMCG